MKRFVIRGGTPLRGEIRASGAKNAVLPLLFATVRMPGVSEIRGVPDIGDVRVALAILSAYGARAARAGDTLFVDTTHLSFCIPPRGQVSAIRASSYLIGASLARFGRVRLLPFGGCRFADRPIDMHLTAARAFGARIDGEQISAPHLTGADICFPRVSVGATVNALLLAASAQGETRITGAAEEPHVLSLIAFLNSGGAQIRHTGRGCYHVVGRTLHAGSATVIPDMIEAVTYLLAAPMTGGDVTVTGVDVTHLAAPLSVLERTGVSVRYAPDAVRAFGRPTRPATVYTAPYPGFPTDLQPQFAALVAHTGGRVCEQVFPDRFGYLASLAAFGIRSERTGATADIFPSRLHPADVTAPDLRGGAASVLTALAVDGQSRVEEADIVLRGYADFADRLASLGADIRTEETPIS